MLLSVYMCTLSKILPFGLAIISQKKYANTKKVASISLQGKYFLGIM